MQDSQVEVQVEVQAVIDDLRRQLDNDGPARLDVSQIAAMAFGGVAALIRKLEQAV